MKQIIWLELAVRDRQQFTEFLHEHSPETVRFADEAIERTIAYLAQWPEIGVSGELADTREVAIPGLPCYIIYRCHFKGEAFHVLRLIRGKLKREAPPWE